MENVLDSIESENVEHIFLEQEFNKCCPFYMSIGMTYNEYWFGDPTKAKDYLEAFKIKEKREAEKQKWIMWEQGLYVYEAINCVAPILRAFSKATKPLPYPSKPHDVKDEVEEDKNKMKELEKERDMYKAQIFFQQWAKNTKKSFKK